MMIQKCKTGLVPGHNCGSAGGKRFSSLQLEVNVLPSFLSGCFLLKITRLLRVQERSFWLLPHNEIKTRRRRRLNQCRPPTRRTLGRFSTAEEELCCLATLDSLLPSELPLSTFVHFYKQICCFCCLPTLIEVFV